MMACDPIAAALTLGAILFHCDTLQSIGDFTKIVLLAVIRRQGAPAIAIAAREARSA